MILFISKSLTISVNEKELNEIHDILKFKDINWDLFVKISSSHLILPALYCIYKRKKLLKFIPNELVTYMKKINTLNGNRNLQIIEQISELNALLKKNGINPIFLKGASNLIQGLYEDFSERMVGDIDFLVSKSEYDLAANILLENNYHTVSKLDYDFPYFMHYPRLRSDNKIAAVEIHKEMVNEKYAKEFNFDTVKKNIIHKDGFSFLSYEDQKALSIFSSQINDYNFDYNRINLKNAYDFLLLNNRDSGNNISFRFHKLRASIILFLSKVDFLFGNIGLSTKKSWKVKIQLKAFKILLNNPFLSKIHKVIIDSKLFLTLRLKIIYRSFFIKEYRVWLLKRISDKRWQREKLVQLKFKKPNNNKD